MSLARAVGALSLLTFAFSPGFFSDKPGPAFSAVAPAVTDADLRPVLMDGLIASIGSKNRDTVGVVATRQFSD